jgi:hypothetical protein
MRKRLPDVLKCYQNGISAAPGSDAWHGLVIAGKIGILSLVRAASEEFS